MYQKSANHLQKRVKNANMFILGRRGEMKKSIFAMFVIMLSVFCLTACGEKTSVSGKFKQSEYVISINDEIDFLSELDQLEGVTKEFVKLTSSNSSVLSLEGDKFVALKSGNAYVLASFEGRTFARTLVSVKYRFSSPTNLRVDDSGLVEWDDGFVVIDGNAVTAESYVLSIAKATDLGSDDIENMHYTEYECQSSFRLTEPGSYYAKIRAVGTSEIDGSENSATVVLNYGTMMGAENIFLTVSDEIGQGQATLTWSGSQGAKYDILIGGTLVANDIENTNFTYDFSNIENSSSTEVQIIAKDPEGVKLPQTSTITVRKLAAPTITYGDLIVNGFLQWSGIENASKFSAVLEHDGFSQKIDYDADDNSQRFFTDLSSGIYNLKMISVGQTTDEGYFLSSNLSSSSQITFAKLAEPQAEVTFEGKNAQFDFTSDGYNNTYLIEWSTGSTVVSGESAMIELGNLAAGDYQFKVTALPNISGGNVQPYSEGSASTSNVINSNPITIDFKVMPEIGQITHSRDGENSVFTFASLPDANYYRLYINGNLFESFVQEDGQIKFTVENLQNITPYGSTYQVRVEAGISNEGGRDIAIKTTAERTLTILSAVKESQNQDYHLFSWEKLPVDAEYKYQIYKVGSDYQIPEGAVPTEGVTTEGQINEEHRLSEGYYVIRITSLSTDENLYLDSDFYNDNGVFTKEFVITKQLETPQVKFTTDNGLQLEIIGSENVGKFDVYIGGAFDSSVAAGESGQTVKYTFKSGSLDNAGRYDIKVIASTGDQYDSTIYPSSNPFELSITRFPVPEFSVTDVFAKNGQWTNEYLSVIVPTGSTGASMYHNQELVNKGGENQIDLNSTEFGDNFEIDIVLNAANASENDYYLSNSRTLSFKRVSAPSNFNYYNGVIAFDNDDINVERNYISLTFKNGENGDQTFYYLTRANNKSISLQEIFDELNQSDTTFAQALANCESLRIQINAMKNGLVGDVYYLPSTLGTTTSGQTTLNVDRLTAANLSFNAQDLTIEWQAAQASGTTFDIYVDGKVAKTDFTANSISIFNLGDVDFTTAHQIFVKSKNSRFLEPVDSNTITVKQLAKIGSITISTEGDETYATFVLGGDLLSTEEVLVNGSSDNVEFTAGDSSGRIALSDFAGSSTFTFEVVAKNEGSTNFFFNSDVTTFELVNLDTKNSEFSAKLDSNIISWNDLSAELVGHNINPIQYILNVTANNKNYTITLTENQFELQSLEQAIKEVITGEASIEVVATVANPYTLTSGSNQAHGFYGSVAASVVSSNKLESTGEIDVAVIDGQNAQNILSGKLDASATFTWENIWSQSGIHFEIIISSSTGKTLIDGVDGLRHADYSFNLVDDKYVLTVNKALLPEGETTVLVRAMCDNMLTSEQTSASVTRLPSFAAGAMTLSEDGILTITGEDTFDVLIQLNISSASAPIEKLYTKDSTSLEIDLMVDGMLADNYGQYSISAIAVDGENMLPSANAQTINGSKLQNIENVEVKDDGYIYLTVPAQDYSDAIVAARYEKPNGQTVEIQLYPQTQSYIINQIKIYIIDLFDAFGANMSGIAEVCNFAFSLRKTGNVNSAWKALQIGFDTDSATMIRGTDLEKDYIIYDENITNTASLVYRIYEYDFEKQTYVLNVEQSGFITADDVMGFWATDGQGEGIFTKTSGANPDLTYTPVAAAFINDLLDFAEYGEFRIRIARLDKDESGLYTQRQYRDIDYSKLNTILVDPEDQRNITISNNVLQWFWTSAIDQAEESYRPTAYYVHFAPNDGSAEHRVLAYSNSLDLRTANLNPGTSYNITVTAVSNNNQIIASESAGQVSAMRYYQPISVNVKNGRLVFDEEQLKATDFMQAIINYFANPTSAQPLYQTLATQTFTSPFMISGTGLANATIGLRFATINGDAQTGARYELNVRAVHLFPDFQITNATSLSESSSLSWLELLDLYADSLGSTDNEVAARTIIDALTGANKGLFDDAILFDDIAKNVPAGRYNIVAYHKGSDNIIDSDFSQAHEIFVTASAAMVLDMETSSEGNNYVVTFGSSQTYIDSNGDGQDYTLTETKQYKMFFRYGYQNVNGSLSYESGIEFMIRYVDGNWEIYCGDTLLDGVISNVDDGSTIGGFKISLTNLRTTYDKNIAARAGGELRANTPIHVDVYAYSGDNGFVLNGKSATFTLRYLDLPQDSLEFTNGRLMVRTTLDNNNALLMRYLGDGSEQATETFQLYGGSTEILLPRTGHYSYIVLSLRGSISYNTVNVESKTYAIEDLYKLNSPTMTTRDNDLYITYNTSDLNYAEGNTLQFYLSNNNSNGEYYYHSEITRTDRALTYEVGSLNEDGEVANSSELTATEFSSYLLGNSANHLEINNATGNEEHHADFILTFQNKAEKTEEGIDVKMIFSSAIGTISAKMLNAVADIPQIVGGNITWQTVQSLPELADGSSIVYGIDVKYFKKIVSDSGAESYEYQHTDTFYTTGTSLDAAYVSQQYDFFIIEVSAYAGIARAGAEAGAITTIEGEYFNLYNSQKYVDGTTQVLRGQIMAAGSQTQPIGRASTPLLAPSSSINNLGVKDGNVVFYITRDDYGGSITAENSSDAAQRITLYASFTRAGSPVVQQITGSFAFASDSSAPNYVLVTFTPDEGQLNDVSPFDILVYIYTDGQLRSKPLTISNVYKMTAVSSAYYQINRSDTNTIIDFTKYFDNVSIAHDNSCYNITISYMSAGLEDPQTVQITNSSEQKTFALTNNITSLSIRVNDGQDATTVGRKLILSSDTLTLNVESTAVKDGAENLLEITWDETNFKFDWAWTTPQTDEYEYYYTIEVGSVRKTGFTNNTFYMPEDTGTINLFSIQARKITNEGDGTLYLYSEPIEYGQIVRYSLFAGGNGTQSNPYKIESAEQFYDIAKRNHIDQKFYFQLTDNITIGFSEMMNDDSSLLMPTFYGSLDGDGYQISITADRLLDMSNYSFAVDGMISNVTFNKYFALFESIASGAEVSDLKLGLDINYRSLNGDNALVAPLALYNYGSLNGVETSSFGISYLTGQSSANNIFVGGIVGINLGSIENCKNSASFTYNMTQRLNMNFGYAGIAVVNASQGGTNGSIRNSFNSGNKEIVVGLSNSVVYGSGITLYNTGIIERCGNDGNITLSAGVGVTTSTGYLTGIATTSSSGSILNCFNNGQLLSSSGSLSLNVAGISYSLNNGSIKGLVDTRGYALVRSCRYAPADGGYNYTVQGSGTNSNITTSTITATDFDCGNGYRMYIRSVTGGYQASIE